MRSAATGIPCAAAEVRRRAPRPRAASARTGVVGATGARLVGHARAARGRGRRPRARCARTTYSSLPVRAAAPSVRDRAQLGALRGVSAGVIRDAGSYTPKCATTVGANSSTNSASRSRSRGSMRRNSRAAQPAARRHEVDADDLARPRSRCSISCATRVPSSPPMPVTSTRIASRPRRPDVIASASGPQVREQDHLPDRRDAGEQHHQPVDADAQAAAWAAARTRARARSRRRRRAPRRRRLP